MLHYHIHKCYSYTYKCYIITYTNAIVTHINVTLSQMSYAYILLVKMIGHPNINFN